MLVCFCVHREQNDVDYDGKKFNFAFRLQQRVGYFEHFVARNYKMHLREGASRFWINFWFRWPFGDLSHICSKISVPCVNRSAWQFMQWLLRSKEWPHTETHEQAYWYERAFLLFEASCDLNENCHSTVSSQIEQGRHTAITCSRVEWSRKRDGQVEKLTQTNKSQMSQAALSFVKWKNTNWNGLHAQVPKREECHVLTAGI